MKKTAVLLSLLIVCFLTAPCSGTASGGEKAVTEASVSGPDVTAAFPVADARDVWIENESARELTFAKDAPSGRLKAYIVGDASARVRMVLTASDDPWNTVCSLGSGECPYEMADLVNEQRSAYVLDVPMPGAQDDCFYVRVRLSARDGDDPDAIDVYLISHEGLLDALRGELSADGWEQSGAESRETAEQEAPDAYVLYAVDQRGEAVPGVFVTFCTDLACVPAQSDENGVITFAGAPENYHVQLIRVPEGYGFDPDFELETGSAYGEWQLRIRKDRAGEEVR